MKKLVIKLFLFSLPFLILAAIEVFVLPIDFFTFRGWEALRIQGSSIATGKFYPNMRLTTTEVGRTMHGTDKSIERVVTWITDRYGYRKENTSEPIRIVLVGDSHIAGDGIDQDQLLSEVLEERLGVCVYPMAPANIKSFLDEPRFIDNPPDIVIRERVASAIGHLDKPEIDRHKVLVKRIRNWLMGSEVIGNVDIWQDRFRRGYMLNFTRARIRELLYGDNSGNYRQVEVAGGPMYFGSGEGFFDEQRQEQIIEKALDRICRQKQALDERGIEYILMPLPDKEAIYSNGPDKIERMEFYQKLIQRSRQSGVHTIDLQSVFEKSFEQDGAVLYIRDDTHWNGRGVKVAADELEKFIKTENLLKH